MDVTCEKCGAEYEFDGTLVSETGTSVKCTSCGHVFKIFRVDGGSVAGARRPWTVRFPDGTLESIGTLRELQRLITIGRLPGDAEISRSGENWKRLRDIVELETFFMAAKVAGVTPQAAKAKPSAPPPRPPAPTPKKAEVAGSHAAAQRIQTLPPPGLVDPSIPPGGARPPKASTPPPPPAAGHATRPSAPPPNPDARKAPSGSGTLAWDQPPPPPARSIPPQSGGTLAWAGTTEGAAEAPKPSVRPRALHASEEDLAGIPGARRGVPPLVYVGIGLAIGVGATAIALWATMPNGPAATSATAPATTTTIPHAADDASIVAEDATAPVADAAAPQAAEAPPTVPTAALDASASTATPPTPSTPPTDATKAPAGRGEASAVVPNRDFEYYVDRGRTLIEAGDSRGARAHFEAALRMRPNDPDALVGLGWVAANAERHQEAIERFREAAARGSTEAYIGLGQMYRTLGRTSDAIAAYRAYLDRNPGGSYARVAQRWISQLTPTPATTSPSPTPSSADETTAP